MNFYYIKDDYIVFLKQYDSLVSDNKKESRPYIGTVIEVDGYKYYAPFSSPKPKHKNMKNSLDFRKIDKGNLGAINLNNMIPVVDSAIIPVNFNSISDAKYRKLLQKQYIAINKDCNNIKKAAKKLREVVCSSDDKLTQQERCVKTRCCDMLLLEEKSKEYDKIIIGVNQSKSQKEKTTDMDDASIQPTITKKNTTKVKKSYDYGPGLM